ncbi:J domain-containing protein [Rubrivirga marina]|uniref:J domain-containing protein n=1 Tax=Rubrivirga marina TaxID=1196024 RepID=A0A271J3U0_9BACT|nr:J domain-containing protein [Rubrivirga marina]PAP78186.1 hypothetical protein BSZ37_18005 [Rubrivirga marina]
MTAIRSPFDVLGLTEVATPEEVRKAYRRLALRYHPDRNPGDAAAAEAFLEVKEAFEQLHTDDLDAGFDVERVVAEMERAAAEVERRRGRSGGTARAWQQVHVPLERPQGDRLREGLASRQALAGLGIAVVVAFGTVLGGLAPVWLGVGVGLGVGGGLIVQAVRSVDEGPWAVETHWQGLRDLRWDVLLSWSEIRGVREADGVLDLALTPAAQRRLARLVPGEAFPEAGAYRLPLRDPARLGAVVRAQLGEGPPR